jgi:hypothetical protein
VITERDRLTCRRYGKYWRIDLDDRSVVVEDLVGVRHLATLLANPHVELLASELTDPTQAGRSRSRQQVLDGEALRQFRARTLVLRADLDEAEALREAERAAALRAELDWLTDELRRSAGLRGRSRDFVDETERARIAVGKAIRRALQRISAADAAVGEALTAAVQTGMYCCYRPLSAWSR